MVISRWINLIISFALSTCSRSNKIYFTLFFIFLLVVLGCSTEKPVVSLNDLATGFKSPPDSSKPGVYWFVMDGWITKENVTKDFEAMKSAGIGRLNMMVVNVGIPKGPVEFLGEEWLGVFKHIVNESKRLGLEITMPVGPGWTGSGGPWIAADQSMQLLLDTSIHVTGNDNKKLMIPLPQPAGLYDNGRTFTEQQNVQRRDHYRNIAVLAFPTPTERVLIDNIEEKALYDAFKEHGFAVTPMLMNEKSNQELLRDSITPIAKHSILDITNTLQPDGSLTWEVPPGSWTIMRFVSRDNGANNSPAPRLGLGFESNKMDSSVTRWHLDSYIGRLLNSLGENVNWDTTGGGIKTLHFDSWEVGTQNWTTGFREEFAKRRGYDPLLYYPVYRGLIVGSREESERFLWDMRRTSSELILENYDDQIRNYAHDKRMTFSIEPYVTPISDIDHGARADYPMGEFWSDKFQLGQDVTYGNFEAASIGHIEGRPVVQAEAFTADKYEAWKQYPWSMKNQGDWAFATGINRFYYHVFVHKALADSLIPGMTMGIWGVHWDRKQTWWPMVGAYHHYISRCQYLLQQGRTVADILYLVPEDIPQYFLPPRSSLAGDSIMPDRREYNFDACSPSQLMKATVVDHKIVFPSGASYRIMVLPHVTSMTPELLTKIMSLVESGARIVGIPPKKSPSLSNYPACDQEVELLARKLWGDDLQEPLKVTTRKYGKGEIIWGGEINKAKEGENYSEYKFLVDILQGYKVEKDFESSGPLRYTHRLADNFDIYFVSNRTDSSFNAKCTFRVQQGTPKLWDPIDGRVRNLPEYEVSDNGLVTIPLYFDDFQSYFVVFSKEEYDAEKMVRNFPEKKVEFSLEGPWDVKFEHLKEKTGSIQLDSLVSWTTLNNDEFKYFSGIAEYSKVFELTSSLDISSPHGRVYLYLGDVEHIAAVSLNGLDLGAVWSKPWKVDITEILKQGRNQLTIKVANLWINRLIGDAIIGANKNKLTKTDLLMGTKIPGQVAFSTYNPYKEDSPLYRSGLLGPVTIVSEVFRE